MTFDPFVAEIPGEEGEAPTYANSDVRMALSLFHPVQLVFAPSFSVAYQVHETFAIGATVNFIARPAASATPSPKAAAAPRAIEARIDP